MAENHMSGKVIGVALDGTGYGTDGRIWGGEFLAADYSGFQRLAHLRNVLLPGGDAAVRQPWRMALSYLRDTFGEQLPADVEFFRGISEKQIAIVDRMISRRLNAVQTSSCGRLFDAVAALIGLGSEVTFEGQAAMALESIAEDGVDQRYDFEISDGEPAVLDFRPAIQGIVKDVAAKKAVGEISARFHNTLSAAIVGVCCRIRKSDGLDRVCLSGGTFQNFYLLRRAVKELRSRGLQVFLHSTVPCNDGGIALGQAVVANEQSRQEN
jgi:hydrogenase maturation protein HypF